jgi:hypothetical protein
MDEAEYHAWQNADKALVRQDRATTPCRDCTPLWHRDMDDAGMCDGVPGWQTAPPPELGRLTHAELQRIRRSMPYFDPPPELVTAMHRARWREYQQRRRDAVSA